MKIQMVDLKRQYLSLKEEIDKAISEVLSSTQFILGPQVSEFEKNCSNYLGVNYAIGCANGTDALQIALMALDIKPGDEIITTPFTFVATTEVIALLGAKPVYVDIDENTFNINPALIREKITSKTKAILPVHLYGNPCEMDEIIKIAKEYNLFVIEDSAQAFGAEYKGKKVCSLGDIACISFFPSKNLGCYGDGGMLTTNDENLYQKIKMIASHGSKVRYVQEILSVNSRLDSIQEAILNVKIKFIDQFNDRRIQNANKYSKALEGISQVKTPILNKDGKHIFHQYTLKVERRDELHKHLLENKIPNAIYYPIPLHLQPAFKGYAEKGSLPITERLSNEVLSLPMHPDLLDEEINFISETIRKFYS
ncbi:MAG: DegT/DnrJ/EryC1/StrS family aminotransferase [Ignavibacteria bacterium]|nr:DegT/DnrJ/EryC1/StrS family aminotransferase [Ignavibacteria bacterium]